MVTNLSRSSTPWREDPHQWNSWDHYWSIHAQRIEEHPFINHSRPDTLVLTEIEDEGVFHLAGRVYCLKNAVLDVEKYFESRYFGDTLRIRGISYRYAAWVQGQHPVLRYHNVHTSDDNYHHRIFNWRTGEEVLYETIERYQFPIFSEVLDEMESVVTHFEQPSQLD